MEITGGRGVDIAVDVVPAGTGVIGHAIEVVRSGGTVVLAGVKGGTNMATLDTGRMVYKEITMKAVFTQGADMYRAGIDLLARNLERLAPMHTHEMPLEDADRAIRMLGGEIPGEEAICISLHPIESRKGAVVCTALASLRFPSPLIKPDVRISRIRLSDWLHPEAHGGGPR